MNRHKVIEILKEVATQAITSELNPNELDNEGFEIFFTRIDFLYSESVKDDLLHARMAVHGLAEVLKNVAPKVFEKDNEWNLTIKQQLYLINQSHPTPDISEGDFETLWKKRHWILHNRTDKDLALEWFNKGKQSYEISEEEIAVIAVKTVEGEIDPKAKIKPKGETIDRAIHYFKKGFKAAISKVAKPEVAHCTQCGYHYDSLLKECPTCKGVKSMSDEGIDKIYELFCDWYEDDGSYDEEIKAKLILAIKELPPQEQVTVDEINELTQPHAITLEHGEKAAQAIHELVYREKPPKAEE